jgi:hypothetical protein
MAKKKSSSKKKSPARKKAAKKSARKKTSRPAAKKDTRKAAPAKSNNDMTMAIIGLVVNLAVLPGLGTIIGGQTSKGVWQLVLFAIGIPLSIILIGIPLIIGVWIWALVCSINQIKAAQ